MDEDSRIIRIIFMGLAVILTILGITVLSLLIDVSETTELYSLGLYISGLTLIMIYICIIMKP